MEHATARYRIREFASLTGVTVRALQHYDRFGLLTPPRSASGYRLYGDEEQRRLRHILALRAIGLSLQQIREALTAPTPRLAQFISAQRQTLEQARDRFAAGARVLRRFEERITADDSPLDVLVREIEMSDAVNEMRRYFSEDAWRRWGVRYFEDWPGPWEPVFRDIEASLDADPSSASAQALLARSIDLWNDGLESDAQLARNVRQGYGLAWADRERWPTELKRRYAEFKIQEIAGFLGRASWASARMRGLVHTYTTGNRSIA